MLFLSNVLYSKKTVDFYYNDTASLKPHNNGVIKTFASAEKNEEFSGFFATTFRKQRKTYSGKQFRIQITDVANQIKQYY